MNRYQREKALALARRLLPPEEFERVMSIEINDLGFGFDQFGMEKESAIIAYSLARYVHKYWFRVESDGHDNIPLKGPAILASNHSGVLPIDAVMVCVDVAIKLAKPRVVRAVVDNFAGFLPWVNVFFYRVGQVVGARRNFIDLLHSGEICAVFPEGTRGIGKPFSQRYNLVKFNVGFIELSLTTKTPIVPVAVVGAEEQAPMLGNLKPLARLLGFPYFPITPLFPLLGPLGFIPLPTQYHIRFGEPIEFYREYGPKTVNDPEAVRMLADKVQLAIQDMVNQQLESRSSVFGFGEDEQYDRQSASN
ncbi:MAG TPA: lysophospholipid acyltransferase family protein [bacterium]|nr:lysophospholipid acyltransferase family protein [bacterium]